MLASFPTSTFPQGVSVRKIVAPTAATAAFLLFACKSVPTVGGAGAPSAQAAVQEFLAAAHSGDVRTMATLFGTTSGPITQRDDANSVEKRMRALQCYLTHDSANVLDDRPATSGPGRQLDVELRQRSAVRRTTFAAVPGPHDRWFVSSFDISTVADLCHP
jgi:hypothetical protein